MNIVVSVLRQLIVHYVVDAWEVKPSGCHVCGYKD